MTDDRGSMVLAALVLRAATQVVDEIQRGVAARGFTDVRPAHGFAFVRISRPGGATVVDLAEHLGITKQAASQLVGQLVERGYVLREDDPRDGRSQVLRLTDRGRECTRVAEQAAAVAVARWRDQLGVAGLAGLQEGLSAICRPGPLRPGW